ncbi:ATP-binding protein [Shewanella subflava]|uniref:ATP-binding protein n=1 Tax=Shewanella subflava TaxID=2986476 RepID=A0ABT3I629_9GAMM|nr:ATP-binding protein [Shewanella subflava]MCW3171410.1 ATP-binding protein [Shewanella subflava]
MMQNMNSELSKLLTRLNAPVGIQPASREHIAELKRKSEVAAYKEHIARKTKKLLNLTGLNTHFLSCHFDNYYCDRSEQFDAVEKAKRYCEKFTEYSAVAKGFLFSGTSGTGKNHLASAMVNELVAKNHFVVLLSVMDLLAKVRESYKDSAISEEKLMNDFLRPDLLIIDELGLQRGSVDEVLWLTRIIDKRLYARKPTSFITNLKKSELQELLGERAYGRILESVGLGVLFNWPSYRVKRAGGSNEQ